jgi:hypothetical protein
LEQSIRARESEGGRAVGVHEDRCRSPMSATIPASAADSRFVFQVH